MSKRLHTNNSPTTKRCPDDTTDVTLEHIDERIERVITLLVKLQDYTERLHDMCLQVEQEDSSGIDK